MNFKIFAAFFLTMLIELSVATRAQAEPPQPLRQAHAHNDYEHTRPLLDALAQGFCSIEADIYLVNSQLLVAHDRNKVSPERTLQSLYLEPLRKRVRENGGRVYQGGPTVILLIDVKSEAESTYSALRAVLQTYGDILTRFTGTRIETNAVTAIISGNRAPQILSGEPVRYAALDGRAEDLNGSSSASLIPLVSEDWKSHYQWRGRGPFPEGEKASLAAWVGKAHAQGRWVRFWGAPDQPEVWRVLAEAQVDLLNADDLPALRQFLSERKGGSESNRP